MSHARPPRRLVILIDGSEQRTGKTAANPSSIQRLQQVIRDDSALPGTNVSQTSKYYVAIGHVSKLSERFRSKSSSDNTAELVRNITRDICSVLERPDDELWLYGSGHGAFVALAVAGIVHHMGLPKTESAHRFDDLFDCAQALIKAGAEDDFRNGPQLMQTIQSRANGPPRIPFVGLLDTVKLTSARTYYETSFVPFIEKVRHAVAINETRADRQPQLFHERAKQEAGQSLVEAWFVGTAEDMSGGSAQDGLSLYPLQWILVESMQAGLSLAPATKAKGGEDALTLLFPQYVGSIPPLDGSEDVEWRINYSNGVQVSMFDLQSTHAAQPAGESDHSLRLDPETYGRNATRKIFNPTGLKGWNDLGANGTIIHPSVFCILDRYPRYTELPSFRFLRHKLANFQDKYMIDEEGTIAPWLRDMQLQASGVKAFRILVCGKTGVGKSTLINKVFGVEMTEESKTYQQGVHDINVAFESPRHPGLLIHDSRGWQAGSDTELELIAKFLRHRAFQQDPAEALHVIWFCVDADVSRIEEADKRTFATIAQFSHHVPVFVIGTKKDKLTGYRKMQLLEELMEKLGDYKEAKKQAEAKANEMATQQFDELRTQLSEIEHYKADGFCCLSKDDDVGVKDLLSQTLGLIADERVRLFCVAAQVVDVEQKINSAITECMRLGTHAIRTAAIPLPLTGMIGTPTISRLICESVLQCFGFPKTTPAEVERIMSDIVMGNLGSFMKVSITQFCIVGALTLGAAIPTAGIGAVLGLAGCLCGFPPTARMLLKCSCDMILILERSFRYDGKYVSTKQIEDAAKYYTTATIKTFSSKEKGLQQQVHDEIDQLIPLKKVSVGFKFGKLRASVEEIIYNNRFERAGEYSSLKSASTLALDMPTQPVELDAGPTMAELPGDTHIVAELDSAEILRKMSIHEKAFELSASDKHGNDMVDTLNWKALELNKASDYQPQTPELEGNTLVGNPREELPGSVPDDSSKDRKSGGFRWKPSSWKLSKKSKAGETK